ncbi:MAG: ABC-ATPase domain-containing protein [Leptolyngbyaceae bacterium]|nr:ABC-ATPase domain-containing protein [Leptolyngbyaceae bacterium]
MGKNGLMVSAEELRDRLLGLDRASYKAYKSIRGPYQFPNFVLLIDYVQGDPFAAPSRVRVQVPQRSPNGSPIAGFPSDTFNTPSRAIALRDYLTRQFSTAASRLAERRGSGKSGLVAIATPGQQVLERSSVWVTETQIEARFVVGLPAQGRRILGRQAAELLCEDIPSMVNQALLYSHLNADELYEHLEVVEDTDWLRSQLPAHGLVSFIPDGAILPRQSGVSDVPLQTESVVPFRSPDRLRVTFQRPNQGKISGMGIPQGITLIVGGGYHGKSTLLRAIALGVYSHLPGDGREGVVTDPTAVKVRAEDGRSVQGVDISPFINHLPQGRTTTHFSTENASGSTSQAATIIEAIEAGATTLLVDEDTSATNFMIRDRRMQALIAKEKEPITPFIDKIRQLYDEYGVSTVLVMGGSGDYFDVADTVIGMDEFQPQDLTEQAKAIAQTHQTLRQSEGGAAFGTLAIRRVSSLLSPSSDPRGPKLKVRGTDDLRIGREDLDVTAIEQLVDDTQLRSIGGAIAYLQEHNLDEGRSLSDLITLMMDELDQHGLDLLTPYPQGDGARFRAVELAAVINRLRSLRILCQDL